MKSKLAFILLLTSTLAQADTPPFALYGFLLPSFHVASSSVDSFSQPNQSAYTAAGNPVIANVPLASRTSFQVAQSRFGFLVKPSPSLKGRMEFDFIDFSKASPTTAALPRVRRAVIDYKVSDTWTLHFGQDWDLLSPLAPHTFNYVGHYFQSGDIGFMRIALGLTSDTGSLQHGFSVGLPGNNATASDQTLELGRVPTIAIRETLKLDRNQMGASALATLLRFNKNSPDLSVAGAVTIFAELNPSERLSLRTEAYIGQNTYNLGLLGLSFGNATFSSVQEAGGYFTFRHTVGKFGALFGGAGAAFILDPTSMSVAYTPAFSLAGSGPGIERNITVRVGYEQTLEEGLLTYFELAGLATRHHLAASELATQNPNRTAMVAEAGMQLSF